MSKIILHLCADTGSDTKPYKDAGYDVRLVGSDVGVENYHPPKNVYGVIANPPCLEFSRARTGGVARNPEEGMKLVKECLRIIDECDDGLKFWVIENPATGALRTFLGTPVYEYQPWWYGSPWTKKTALWGRFNKPERTYQNWEDVPKNPNLWVRKRNRIVKNDRYTGKPEMHTLHKSACKNISEFSCFNPDSDMEFRSLCSQKFAQAFFEVNQ
jgi:hypothetical protein